MTEEQYCFGLTMLKLALRSQKEPRHCLSPPMWQNTLPSPMETKDFALTLQAGYSLQPYLKDTGLQRGERVQQGTPPKALIFNG